MKRRRRVYGPTVVNVKSGGGFKTVIIVILLLGILGYIGFTLAGNFGWFKDKPPEPVDAPWQVVTVDRFYYVLDFKETDGYVTLYDFWEKVGDRWIHRTIPLPLEKAGYHRPIKISRRAQ
jgi:hypothetical protein